MAAPRHIPPRGHLIFHIPVAQLHHRCLSRQHQAPQPLARLRLLCVLLPPARGRTNRSCPRLHPPDTPSPPHQQRDVRLRRILHHGRPLQESRHQRLHQRQFRRASVRPARPLQRSGKSPRRLWLHPANLLRLLRLLRHGNRHSPPARIPVPQELRQPIQIRQHHRVLASLAHQPLIVAQRLPLHQHGRQSPRQVPSVLQPAHDHAPRRLMARRIPQLHPLGRTAWPLPLHRQDLAQHLSSSKPPHLHARQEACEQ